MLAVSKYALSACSDIPFAANAERGSRARCKAMPPFTISSIAAPPLSSATGLSGSSGLFGLSGFSGSSGLFGLTVSVQCHDDISLKFPNHFPSVPLEANPRQHTPAAITNASNIAVTALAIALPVALLLCFTYFAIYSPYGSFPAPDLIFYIPAVCPARYLVFSEHVMRIAQT